MNSEQRTSLPTIRYVVFGKVGVGKSIFGNVLLGTNVFKEPFSHSNTDTFDDDKLLKDLTSYFQNDFQGLINYFLLLHKPTNHFTSDIKKTINMLFTSFVG